MEERSFKHIWRILGFLFIIAIGWMIATNSFMESITAFMQMAFSDNHLFTDYLLISGIGSTLINVILVVIMVLVLMKKNDVSMTGFAYAGIFIMLGFAFFGKNYCNIIPIFLGVYLYSKMKKALFKQYLIGACFATCLAPFTSIALNHGILGIAIGCLLGVFIGFVICPIAESTIRFHSGFLLYNYGFAAGIISIILISVFRIFGYEFSTNLQVNESMDVHWLMVFMIVVICLYFIIIGLTDKKDQRITKEKYKKLLSMSGRAITDYYRIFGQGLTFINMGIMGLMLLIVALCFGLPLNGPTVGAIFTGIGFAAFGKNPKNTLPLILGCTIMLMISQATVTPSAVVSALFVTGIAPIAGEYGFIVGIIAGMLHFSLSSATSAWQGGMNLYNNGFASGFVAGAINSVASNILKGKDE